MSVFDDLDAQKAAVTGQATVPPDTFADLDTAAPPDKYRAAAEEEYARLHKAGAVGGGYGLRDYTQRAGKGAGMNWTEEIMAGATVPLEMIKRGVNPSEAYGYTRAREQVAGEKAAEATKGPLGATAEVLGGLATGAGVLGSGTRAGAVALPYINRTVPAAAVNWGINTGKAAGLGAVAGAGEGDTLESRAKMALIGGGMGGVLGGVLPVAAKSALAVGSASQLPRLRDVDDVAITQLAEVARNAGVTPQELFKRIQAGNVAGQPFTVADALGYEGQRKLTAMAKVPGPQRERIVETLTARDLNMPHRAGSQVGASMGAPTTAAAATEALIDTAGTRAAPLYREAERHPAWSERIQQFIDDPIARQGLRQGVEIQRLNTVGTDRPFNPRDAMITSFNEAGDPIITGVPNMQTLHTLKVGLDRMIEAEVNPATRRLTARGNALNGYKNRLLEEIDSLNPAYREARQAYGGPMQVRAAVERGQEMPTTGRAEDNVRLYNALPPTQQQGVRIGYADAVRAPMERTGNFNPLLREKSLKGQTELEAMAPYGPNSLREFLAREEQMLKTSKNAIGGSPTVENAADVAAGPGGAAAFGGMASSAMSGNPVGFVRNALEALQRFGKGESEAQRVAITRALLETEPSQVRAMADRIADYELRRRGVNPFVERPPRFREGQ